MTYICIYWFEVTWNHFKMIYTKLEYSSKNQRWLPWYLLFNLCLIFHHQLITDWSFHSCIKLAKASYNRISCMCLPNSCWVAIVQHGGHCEWCKLESIRDRISATAMISLDSFMTHYDYFIKFLTPLLSGLPQKLLKFNFWFRAILG